MPWRPRTTGNLPEHLPPSRRHHRDWRITLPDWCRDQRNQMTGPADDGGAGGQDAQLGRAGVMLDLEDSMANALAAT